MNLPDDVLIKIYYFKHQLDFKDVINELKSIIIKSFFNISVGLENMCYLHDNLLYKCININNLNITSKQILNTIKIIFN